MSKIKDFIITGISGKGYHPAFNYILLFKEPIKKDDITTIKQLNIKVFEVGELALKIYSNESKDDLIIKLKTKPLNEFELISMTEMKTLLLRS